MKGAVQFDHVSKRYRIGTWGSLRGALSSWLSRESDDGSGRQVLWAVRDLSFKLMPGASLGVVGPNGSGKTTTLKLLSNVTYPTLGKIVMDGRVSSLIELGAGFHPELTGRENIYLNGAILGLSRREITSKLDAIIDFSGIERFIDTPVKRYSSGMYVRLGFAVAAHVEPDILVVDEVLAVGDASFRQRCVQRMKDLRQSGTTLLFVSHNLHLVRSVCDSAILLVEGQVRAEGKPSQVISEYEKMLTSAGAPTGRVALERETLQESGNMLLRAVEVIPAGGGVQLVSHASALVRISYVAAVCQRIGRVHIAVYLEDNTLCCVADSAQGEDAGFVLDELAGEGAIEVTFEPLQLATGNYYAVVRITDAADASIIASRDSSLFTVLTEQSGDHGGVFVPRVSWKHRGAIQPQRSVAGSVREA
jgi:ABC-type polysaccharide/polyol phosphate transport system ATPase subunit